MATEKFVIGILVENDSAPGDSPARPIPAGVLEDAGRAIHRALDAWGFHNHTIELMETISDDEGSVRVLASWTED